MRWSTTRSGLAVPPYERGCHVVTPEELETRRLVTMHHGQWPRRNYDERYASVFRNLITNVYPLLAHEHAELHNEYDPPKRPPNSLMIEVVDDFLAINGVIECVREKKTRSTYQIDADAWQVIKGGYRGQSQMAG